MDASNTTREITNSKVPAKLKDNLTKAVTTDVVKRAMFSITRDKAVGHGLNVAFYHKNWNIEGGCGGNCPILSLLLVFFLEECYCTAITRVPETWCPATMKDFMPIACCNVHYKILASI